jgi:hypothetical protein
LADIVVVEATPAAPSCAATVSALRAQDVPAVATVNKPASRQNRVIVALLIVICEYSVVRID